MMRIVTALALATTLGLSTTASAEGSLRASLEAEAAKVAFAQATADRDSGWQRVERLEAGEDIIVRLHDGTAIPGKFVHADQSSMRLNNPRNSRLIPRRDIYRIDMARGRGSLIGAAIGAAAGAVAGLVLYAQYDWNECRCALSPGGAAVIPIGAAIGLGVVGYRSHRHDPERIYLAP